MYACLIYIVSCVVEILNHLPRCFDQTAQEGCAIEVLTTDHFYNTNGPSEDENDCIDNQSGDGVRVRINIILIMTSHHTQVILESKQSGIDMWCLNINETDNFDA